MVHLIKHYSLESLPSIYDEESMTALELAGRLAHIVNECIDAVNGIQDIVKQAFDDHLDSGEFAEAIDKYAGDVAKKVNQRIDSLVGGLIEGSTTMDAEIVDARRDVNEDSYPTAGSNIRAVQDVFTVSAIDPVLDATGFYDLLGNFSWNGSPADTRLVSTKAITVPYPVVVRSVEDNCLLSVCYWEHTGSTNCEDANGPYGVVNGNAKTYDTGWVSEFCLTAGRPFTISIKRTDADGDDCQMYKMDALRIKTEKPACMEDWYNNPLKSVLATTVHAGWNPEVERYDLNLTTRMVTDPFVIEEPLKMVIKDENYKVALHSWTSDANGQDLTTWNVSGVTSNGWFSHDSGWQSELVIPANEVNVLYFSGPDDIMNLDIFKVLEVDKMTSNSGTTDTVVTGDVYVSTPTSVKAIAHRGYSAGAPENTLPAFTLAKRNGFEYVECDVQKTSDGAFVLCHDLTIDRTSNGTGTVNEMALADLQALDFGSWFGAEYVGTTIPTLSEFLAHCRKLGLLPYIELKGTLTQADIGTIMTTVVGAGMGNECTFISFEIDHLSWIQTWCTSNVKLPNLRLGYVVTNITSTPVSNAVPVMKKCADNGWEFFFDTAKTPSTTHTGIINDAYYEAHSKYPVINLEMYTIDDVDTIKGLPARVSGVTSNSLHAGKVLMEDYI